MFYLTTEYLQIFLKLIIVDCAYLKQKPYRDIFRLLVFQYALDIWDAAQAHRQDKRWMANHALVHELMTWEHAYSSIFYSYCAQWIGEGCYVCRKRDLASPVLHIIGHLGVGIFKVSNMDTSLFFGWCECFRCF